jgi:SNF2 family DNA or RNA helicase
MATYKNIRAFLDDYGVSLAEKVNNSMEVIHDPLRDQHPEMDAFMDTLGKNPFLVQREVIKGAVKAFKNGNNAVYITAEMGVGKTLLSIVTACLLKKNPRVLVLCPPHLVRKWIGEIKDIVGDVQVVNLNGKECLRQLELLRKLPPATKPEFYVIGREKAKTHFQWRPATVKKGKNELPCCPKCGNILMDRNALPLQIYQKKTQGQFKKKYSCENTVPVWQWNPETQSRMKVFKECGEQLWQADNTKVRYRKYMPALFIRKKLKNFFDILIADEVHQFRNQSGQGYAFDVLSGVCKYTLGLTGTLAGGYAYDLFYLLWRTHPHVMIADDNPFRNPTNFMSKYGVLERVTAVSGEDGLTVKSQKRTYVRAKPGVSPLLIGRMLLSNSVFLRLSDMAENLPSYDEDVVELEMDPVQAEAYGDFEKKMKEELLNALERKDFSLLGSYLNALLSYPDRIYQGVTVNHPHTGKLIAYGPPVEGIMPKEEKLLEIIETERSDGRRVLVYIQNSNTTDISPRLVQMIEENGLRVKVLRAGNTEGRSEKIDRWVEKGLDVLICNPRLVETGLDLLAFPAIVFYQTGYSTYTLRQASRRSWRISQTEPVRVYYLAYDGTIQTKAMKLIATKLETSLALEGELTDKGLSALSETSDSMSKELARALLEKIDETGTLTDMWSAYRRRASVQLGSPDAGGKVIRQKDRGKGGRVQFEIF